MDVRQLTLADYEEGCRSRHRLHDVVRYWAQQRPDAPAIINADRAQTLSWAEFDRQVTALSRQLRQLGLGRGDFFATLLPLLTEHILLEFACFSIGVIVVPLDLRLAAAEVVRSLHRVRARAFAFPGLAALGDFRPLAAAVQQQCLSIEHFVQLSPAGETIAGAESFATLMQRALAGEETLDREPAMVDESDGALVIFTTGSTGSPKPALLSHRNITCQAMCISGAFFGADRGTRTLVNLPPSHVGCQTELLMGTLFGGGTAVILESFDPVRSLRAIQDYRIETIGQIPAMFNFEWRLKDYASYDLSSLRFAAYGGHQVTRAFVDKLASMAPVVATGLGLTEAAGFCTYVQTSADQPDAVFSGVGRDMPVYPCSIRGEMRPDGSAGDELPSGEIGNLCFRGPQTFLGYVNDPEATARTISCDGYLYTGDLGFKDVDGLHLTGRAKWVIKPFGYQVFPGDVENHIASLTEKVSTVAVVGVEHTIISEAIVAFVEKKPGISLSIEELERHARSLPAYMRPRHWVLLESGQMPLNRVIKPDYVRLQRMALAEIECLRQEGKWDRGSGD